MTAISAALRHAVTKRANHRCEYCGIAEDAVLVPHEPDHIMGEQHRGTSTLENLAYAWFRCNRFKGPNVATLDPQTRSLVPPFNPRTDRWDEHFRLERAEIDPLTPVVVEQYYCFG